VIGAGFGLIFVLVNTGSFPAAVAVLFRVLAVLAFIAVLLAVVVAERRPSPASADRPMGGGFTLGYWLVVVAEVGAIAAGLAVLNGPLHAPQAAVAWIALVVGIHFIALAAVWKLLFFHGLGVALMMCRGRSRLGRGRLGCRSDRPRGRCHARSHPPRIRPVGRHEKPRRTHVCASGTRPTGERRCRAVRLARARPGSAYGDIEAVTT